MTHILKAYTSSYQGRHRRPVQHRDPLELLGAVLVALVALLAPAWYAIRDYTASVLLVASAAALVALAVYEAQTTPAPTSSPQPTAVNTVVVTLPTPFPVVTQ